MEQFVFTMQYCISSVIRQSFFSFQNNPKNLDLSYKTDQDLWDSLGRVKLILMQNFIGLILSCVVILERGKTLSYSRINMVLSSRALFLEQ